MLYTLTQEAITLILETFLNELSINFDVIYFSETRLDRNKTNNYIIPGYTSYCVSREHKRGGGVALYVKDSFKQTQLDKISFSIENVLDCTGVEIEVENNKKVTICALYRPPNTDIESFN